MAMQEKKKALVLEDQVIHQIAIRNYLSLKGFSVEAVPDGLEGLKKIKEAKFDVIFSDIEMPNMNGLEFLKNLRRNIAYKTVPVIMLTNVTDPNVLNIIKTFGVLTILRKPFTNDTMNTALALIK